MGVETSSSIATGMISFFLCFLFVLAGIWAIKRAFSIFLR